MKTPTVKTRLRQYFSDNRCPVAILAAIAMTLAIGDAIDYARIMALRSRLQQATESAALAALAALNDDPAIRRKMSSLPFGLSNMSASQLSGEVDYQTIARAYIEENFNRDKKFAVTTMTSVDWPNGTMTVSSKTTAPTFLLGLAGIDTVDLSARATAAVGAGGEIQEIAIALDTSFSMNFKGRKETAIAAAKDFIHKVMNYPSGAPNPNVSVALVPFNDYVSVGSRLWPGTPIGVSWLTPTDDRVQKFPQVCWQAGRETKTVEKTACADYSAACKESTCTNVRATCSKDGESYECSMQKCEPLEDACIKPNCAGAVKFQTTPMTTETVCNPAYEVTLKWTGCVGSRDNVSDEIDFADAAHKVSAVFSVSCPNVPIVLLSRNLNYLNPDNVEDYGVASKASYAFSKTAEQNLTHALDSIVFDGATYIAPGLLWAWRAISPEKPVAGWYDTCWNRSAFFSLYFDNHPFYLDSYKVCGQMVAPGNFASGAGTTGLQNYFAVNSSHIPGCPYAYAKKSIILMTDGFSTKSASHDDAGHHEKTDRREANAKLARVCNNIKAKGIRIYTIAFMVNDSDALATLTACASDASSHFDAGNAGDLANAFQTIGNDFTRLRLIR